MFTQMYNTEINVSLLFAICNVPVPKCFIVWFLIYVKQQALLTELANAAA